MIVARNSVLGVWGIGHQFISVIYSDDLVENWQIGEVICRDGDLINGIGITNPSETVAVQKSDKTIMFKLRTESSSKRRLIATNEDGVSDFKIEGFHESLLEPVCMGSLVRYNNSDTTEGISYFLLTSIPWRKQNGDT